MRRLADAVTTPATVLGSERIGRFHAITLGAPALAGVSAVPGQQVRIQVGADNAILDRLTGALRTYSVWRHDGDTLELRVFDHGDVPGARWARTARTGEPVRLRRPDGDFVCRPAPYHLFAGDETASVAFGAMLRGLGADAKVFAVVEVDTKQDQLDLPGDVSWIHRHGAPAAKSATLAAAVAALDLPDSPGVAYLAGEAGTIQLIRTHLVQDRGWDRRQVITKPFWAPGRTGME